MTSEGVSSHHFVSNSDELQSILLEAAEGPADDLVGLELPVPPSIDQNDHPSAQQQRQQQQQQQQQQPNVPQSIASNIQSYPSQRFATVKTIKQVTKNEAIYLQINSSLFEIPLSIRAYLRQIYEETPLLYPANVLRLYTISDLTYMDQAVTSFPADVYPQFPLQSLFFLHSTSSAIPLVISFSHSFQSFGSF